MEWKDATELYDCEIIAISEKAIFVDINGEEMCIANSQIDDRSEISKYSEIGDCGTLIINPWLAKKKGLI
jgi:hypothetical protein